MTRRLAPLSGLVVLFGALVVGGTSLASVEAHAAAPLPAAPLLLTWTSTDIPSTSGGTWDSYTSLAASWVEGGFSDWRLPTPAEAQAAIAGGTFGAMTPNVTGWYLWTSRRQGNFATAYEVFSDANGDVIAALSGRTRKELRGSNLRAKFVRP